MLVFGPVPSRRLGRSIGINNIPPKICSYSCIYCQLGRSIRMTTSRKVYYDPQTIVDEVREKLKKVEAAGDRVDYLTIVPDGEPTLDVNLGLLLDKLKIFDIKTAVITNSTLLTDTEVRRELSHADWVSVKIDTIEEYIWKKIDRPHGRLSINELLDGVAEFSVAFKGQLVTETMLLKDHNDNDDSIEATARFIGKIDPSVAYLSIPTRPPAEKHVKIPDESVLNLAFNIFSKQISRVELLIGYEGNEFAFTGDLENDLLSITSVHPMREDAVMQYIVKAGGSMEDVRRLIETGKLVSSIYEGKRYYLRKPAT